MPKVSLELDARYVRDGASGRFVEVCRTCNAPRSDGATTCARCGATFERMQRSFFAQAWTPAAIAVRFPTTCPCCGRAATTTRTYWCHQYTRARPPRRTHVKLEIPVCDRVRSPLGPWLGLCVSSVFGVLGLTALVDPQPGELVVLALATALFVWSFRAYTRVRFSYFDHRRYVLRVRNRTWAHELAELNGGRI